MISAVAAICLGGAASFALLFWAHKASPPGIGDGGGGIGEVIAWLLAAFLGAIAGLISGTGLGQRTRRD